MSCPSHDEAMYQWRDSSDGQDTFTRSGPVIQVSEGRSLLEGGLSRGDLACKYRKFIQGVCRFEERLMKYVKRNHFMGIIRYICTFYFPVISMRSFLLKKILIISTY